MREFCHSDFFFFFNLWKFLFLSLFVLSKRYVFPFFFFLKKKEHFPSYVISLVKDFLYEVNIVFTNPKTLFLCIAVNIENFQGEGSLRICLGRQLFFFFSFFPSREEE